MGAGGVIRVSGSARNIDDHRSGSIRTRWALCSVIRLQVDLTTIRLQPTLAAKAGRAVIVHTADAAERSVIDAAVATWMGADAGIGHGTLPA